MAFVKRKYEILSVISSRRIFFSLHFPAEKEGIKVLTRNAKSTQMI